MKTTEQVLHDQIAEIRVGILANSKDVNLGQILFNEMDTAVRLLSDVSRSPKPRQFSGIIKPIQAVLKYLESRDTAVKEDEIVTGLLAGDWAGGNPKAALTLHKSIKIYCHGTGARKKLIRELNGLIGVCTWPDSKFKPVNG